MKTEVQADVDALKEALEKQDNDEEVQAAFEKLQQSQTKIGEALYSQSDQDGAQAEPETEDEDIVDAEVIDEDDKK